MSSVSPSSTLVQSWTALAVGAALAVLATAPARAQSESDSVGALTVRPYTVATYAGERRTGEIGRVTVLANPALSSSRRLPLAFVRFPSTNTRPGSPIVFLMGGPGIPASVMARVPVYDALFQRLRTVGDVILVDQRGVGESAAGRAALSCAAAGGADTAAAARRPADTLTFDRATVGAVVARSAARCVDAWRRAGETPATYTTRASASDLEILRRALGASKLNLLAFSYGTRLALAYVDAHPDRVARVVLAGTNGPGHALKLPSTLDLKFRQLAWLARQDSAVVTSHQRLRGEGARADRVDSLDLVASLEALLRRGEMRPFLVPAVDATGARHLLRVGREGLQMSLGLRIDDPRLPALLLSAERGDDTLLTAVVREGFQALTAGATSLVPRAINCSADRPAARRLRIRDERRALLGEPAENMFLTDEFCRVLGFGTPPREFAGPVWSTAPALFVTGTLDSNTPAFQAEEVRRGFPHAAHLTVEGGGHEALPIPAVQEMVAAFLGGSPVEGARVNARPPRFLDVEAAKRPVPRPR